MDVESKDLKEGLSRAIPYRTVLPLRPSVVAIYHLSQGILGQLAEVLSASRPLQIDDDVETVPSDLSRRMS